MKRIQFHRIKMIFSLLRIINRQKNMIKSFVTCDKHNSELLCAEHAGAVMKQLSSSDEPIDDCLRVDAIYDAGNWFDSHGNKIEQSPVDDSFKHDDSNPGSLCMNPAQGRYL